MEPVVKISLREYESLKKQIEAYEKASSNLIIRSKNHPFHTFEVYTFFTKDEFITELAERNNKLENEIISLQIKTKMLEKEKEQLQKKPKNFWKRLFK